MSTKEKKLIKIKSCILCGKADDDKLMFGEFFHKPSLSVHHNCLFFASGMVQRCKSNRDGILGFLMSDIRAEASRGMRFKCFYCKKVGATVGCVSKSCKKVFHFPCGVQYHSLHQYYGGFASYCEVHKPKQKNVPLKEELYCYICCTAIHQSKLKECLFSPCCRNNWFHRECVQRYAFSAGAHFLKCPLCNNKNQFIETLLRMGIHIPMKDAEWELENNAFQELYSRPTCDSSVCKCHKGKDHDGHGMWKLLSCSVCGSRATHRYCRGLRYVKSWMCKDCEDLKAEMKSRKKSTKLDVDKQLRYNLNTLNFTCDSQIIRELLRRKPVVKLVPLEKLIFT